MGILRDEILVAMIMFLIIIVSTVLHVFQTKDLCQEWIHSYEEDTKEIKVYRPASYDFPFGWNREKMKIMENRVIVLYEIAPNDAMNSTKASWDLDESTLKIVFPNNSRETVEYTIVECNKTILKLKK